MSTDQKATRESLLAEFKTARDAAIIRSQMGMEQIAQRHRQERADALKEFAGKRADIEAAFEKDGAPAGAWPSLMAMEQSRHMEPLIQQQTKSMPPTWQHMVCPHGRVFSRRNPMPAMHWQRPCWRRWMPANTGAKKSAK